MDLWGGYRDVQLTTPWTADTITNVWSSTKTVTDLAALLLVERGLLDVYAPVARLAAQPPWWEPGTASGYHAHNQGRLIGEVIRRISGKKLKLFVAEEIAGTLGADFQIGAREADWGRIADVVAPPPLPFDLDALGSDSPMYKTFMGPPANPAAANTRRGDTRTWGRSTATGTPAPSPGCCPPWRAGARSTACGCCPRQRST